MALDAPKHSIPSDATNPAREERRRRRSAPIDPRALVAAQLALVVSTLRRRKLPLIICALAVPLIAFVALKQVIPQFTAEGSAIYEPVNYAAQELQSILRVDPMTDAVMASQAEVMHSLSIAERLTDRFQLAEREEFNPLLRPPSLPSRVLHALRGGLYSAAVHLLPPVAPLLAPAPPKPLPTVEEV